MNLTLTKFSILLTLSFVALAGCTPSSTNTNTTSVPGGVAADFGQSPTTNQNDNDNKE